MEFDRRYKQLNAKQKKAVDHIDGPLMVIAGPGTGKTELLSIRAANILKRTDTLPENILCLTFTDSGASAMRQRLVGIIGKEAYKVSINTFHSFGTEIINKYREYFYNNAIFSPADEIAQYQILQSIFKELDHNNPLSVTMNGEFTYLKDTKTVISELKRSGGITSDELLAVIQQDEASLDQASKLLIPVFSNRISNKTVVQTSEILPELHQLSNAVKSLYSIEPLVKVMSNSLQLAVQEAEDSNSTKPLTAWKNQWIGKDENKNPIFKDKSNLAKLKSLSFIYYEYLRRMESAGLYDYDDMILQVIHSIEVHDDLKASLQEQYQYIMVDEFQDTNNAQMRILHNLIDNPVNEGAPNIMTVGDDDQAIYSFQGAEVSNMMNFKRDYPSTEIVVLTDNYRSGENILSASREVILQGSGRLESQIPMLVKELSANKNTAGRVQLTEHESPEAEMLWITNEIQNIIAENNNESIAILARNHKELLQILPFLQKNNIPVRYEKQDNALDQPPIIQLDLLSRVVVHLAKSQHEKANQLLPELLSHPAWEVDPKSLWKLSLDAYDSKRDWMTTMSVTPEFSKIHELLTGYITSSQTLSLESTLDLLIGKHDDEPGPLFKYFFSEDKIQSNPEEYLNHFMALKSVRDKLNEHGVEEPKLTDLVDFIDTYRQLGLTIKTAIKNRGSNNFAVDLLTAHKSKGLEYDHIYVMQAIDNKWGQTTRVRNRSIKYPKNLNLAPAGDSADERLRLFYVAMTRAKSHLNLTYSTTDSSGKQLLPADFIASTSFETNKAPSLTIEQEIMTQEISWKDNLVGDSSELIDVLKPRLEKYKLSATAFTSFLDVTKGGPKAFLLDNLLRFPRASSTAIIYGNAIHYALQQAHVHVIARGESKPVEDVLNDFEQYLKKERLNKEEFEKLLQKGGDHLPAFLAQTVMTRNQKAELAFSHQEVMVGEAKLTGKIDVATFDESAKTISVTDYKTGRPPANDNGSDAYSKTKLYHYHQQLLFYKLLLQGSRDYSNYTVEKGNIAFVQPMKSGDIKIIEKPLDQENLDRQVRLIQAVWKHIMELNLPDTSSYSNDLKGILTFEQDLIDEKI